ncbi:hypothetical protein PG985_004817 [Apiospora marii]|uniref:uncharacterized protein n=1 Tax=Apiospora marii TaxID=335849 RepID=UPI003130993A
MIVPNQEYLRGVSWGLLRSGTDSARTAWDADHRTRHDLTKEWKNPSVVVATVLMLFGSDVIRSALAQASGTAYVPVCFSFGWVSYALNTLIDIFGDGRLLPKPDYPAKVFALTSKYVRENRNWVVGRIVRDHQTWVHRKELLLDNKIRITIYDVKRQGRPCRFSQTRHALTAGNGSRDIIIIRGAGHCMKLEELAAHESPMFGGPWLKFRCFSAKERQSSSMTMPKEIWGVPKGFFVTVCSTMVLAVWWLLVFITVPGIEGHTWALILVAGIGFLHNAIVAGLRRKPKERNLPLTFLDSILTRNIMDGLMDLEVSYPGCGAPLVGEFIPGELAKKAMEYFSPKAAKGISTTTHVSVVLPSISQIPIPATGPNLTEPSSCTEARHAAVAMDLQLSPNAPLLPADWLQGCREIQDNLKQIADAFLPPTYLPKEKFNEVVRRANCRLGLRVRGGAVVLGQRHLEELVATGLGTSLDGRVAVQGRMVCAKLNSTDERVDVE